MNTCSEIRLLAVLLALPCVPILARTGFAEPPAGFQRTVLNSQEFDELVGVEPMGDGRILIWERGGRVFVSDPDGNVNPTPFLDIQEEVLDWRDHGMLGLAVDPDFLENGYVYLLYAVDPHHLHEFGTPAYDPDTTWTHRATIGRLARYQATAQSGFAETDPSTRTILIGATIDTGLPIVHQSHSAGDLFFGTDGSLLLTHGDSANYHAVDGGGNVPDGYVIEALKNGILKPIEDVGAFRAQMIDSMCGKVLRIDPATGEGLSSNPFYDSAEPDSPRSRVWSLGLRNPFRCSVLPGSGSSDPADGNPGTIAISDVGWFLREENSTVDYAGANLGWPLWEGFDNVTGYWFHDTRHPLALNPLAGFGCPGNFRFRDLIQEERPDGRLFANPCDAPWIEAESMDGNALDLDRDLAGSTGFGSMSFDGNGDEYLVFELRDIGAESTIMRIRYTLDNNTDATLQLQRNGIDQELLSIPASPCPDCWRLYEVEIALPNDVNEIRLQNISADGLNIDRLEFSHIAFTPIPEGIPTFVHHRPDVDWYHLGPQYARVAGYDEGVPVPVLLQSADSPVDSESFMGNCAGGSGAISDESWPAEYRGIFFSDVYFSWLRVMQFDQDGNPIRIRNFDNAAGSTVDMAYDEATNNLYVVRWGHSPLVRYSTNILPPCIGDFNLDRLVDGADLGLFISAWGTPKGDLNRDGTTNGIDLGLLLSNWGLCDP